MMTLQLILNRQFDSYSLLSRIDEDELCFLKVHPFPSPLSCLRFYEQRRSARWSTFVAGYLNLRCISVAVLGGGKGGKGGHGPRPRAFFDQKGPRKREKMQNTVEITSNMVTSRASRGLWPRAPQCLKSPLLHLIEFFLVMDSI